MKQLYGIFRHGTCIYVGCSVDPYGRFKSIRAKNRLKGAALKIFRSAWHGYAHVIEGQIIRAYKRRGQCGLNREIFGKRSRSIFVEAATPPLLTAD